MNEFRTCAVVGVPVDVPMIRRFDWRRLRLVPLLCNRAEEIEHLPAVDGLAVVLTRTSRCSTMFQEAVLRALAVLPQNTTRWVVNLSGEEIPVGIAELRNWEPAPAQLVSSLDAPADCSTSP